MCIVSAGAGGGDIRWWYSIISRLRTCMPYKNALIQYWHIKQAQVVLIASTFVVNSFWSANNWMECTWCRRARHGCSWNGPRLLFNGVVDENVIRLCSWCRLHGCCVRVAWLVQQTPRTPCLKLITLLVSCTAKHICSCWHHYNHDRSSWCCMNLLDLKKQQERAVWWK